MSLRQPAVTRIAALYVATGGCYYGLEGVDPWDKARDARQYPGPYPVIAHPPCERWGRYWFGGPSCRERKVLGDDDGCFAAALAAVREFGGVLEHPEASHAWSWFGLATPPKNGGWVPTWDAYGGWTCCVEQGHYGHRARKATWLYVCGLEEHELPRLKWGKAYEKIRLVDGYHSAEERRRAIKTGICQRLSHKARAATPIPFRDLLISIAAKARRPAEIPRYIHSLFDDQLARVAKQSSGQLCDSAKAPEEEVSEC